MLYAVELSLFIIEIIMFATLKSSLKKRIENDKGNTLYRNFSTLTTLFLLFIAGLMAQIIYSNLSKAKQYIIYFDYIVYIAAIFIPICFYNISKKFADKNADLSKPKWLYVFAVMLLVAVWTNDLHHLFYKKYSIFYSETEFGPILLIFAVWAYLLYILSAIRIVRCSINKSGMITVQSILVILGVLIPLTGNFIGITNIANTNIYLQAILLSITAMLYYIAIIKLKALNVVPVATKTIIDNMTDSFIVLSEDGTIVDINKTCMDKFYSVIELKDNVNLYEVLNKKYPEKLNVLKGDIKEAMKAQKAVNKEYHIQIGAYDKYFDVDIQPIKAKYSNEYVAILLLIRDVTQEKKDMEIMTKNESLVILGELAGGVAHDVNTPISAIKSGITMLKDMSKDDDQKMLLHSMDSCADKIIALVNSLRNQIRNIGSDTVTGINLTSVINDIKIILNNELKKSNVTLELDIKEDICLNGNPTKLSQVITNIVTNAIQAYNGEGGKVEVMAYCEDNLAKIEVKDYASGIPESVRPYIFKNILTTKGVSGTGFGLYLAYSVIKGAFGGDITFDTKTGEGTTFYISIPLK